MLFERGDCRIVTAQGAFGILGPFHLTELHFQGVVYH